MRVPERKGTVQIECLNCGIEVNAEDYTECSICGGALHHTCKAMCLECHTPLCDECSLNNKFLCSSCNTNTVDGGEVIEKVRRSHIDDYEQCPYGFYLSVVKGLENPGNAYSAVGTELHEIFDICSNRGYTERMGRPQTKDDLIQDWDERFGRMPDSYFEGCQKRLSTKSFKEACYQKGLANIDNYWAWEATRPAPWRSEENIVMHIDADESLPKVSITMDRIDLVNGEYEVVDYKTGKTFVGKKLASYLQTPLYIIMIEKYYGIRISRFRYMFFGENKERVFERLNDDKFACTVGNRDYLISLSDCVKRVKSNFAKIRNGQFNIMPSRNNWYCNNLCAHRKNHHCEGAMAQSWINANN